MVRWVVGSILHGGPIELFLVPAVVFAIMSVKSKSVAHVAAAGFLSRESGNHIYVSTYFEVSDTPTRGHSLWHGQ